MHSNPVAEKVVGRPRLTIVLVHGKMLDAASMEALANRLALEDVRYLFPQADENSWYPQSFVSEFEENEPQLTAAITHYNSVIIGLLATGLPADRIVVGGFSQGACLTAALLCHHPRRFGAAILWTGGLIGPDGLICPARPELAGMPAYLSSSEDDPYVPSPRIRQTAKWLIGSGALPTLRIFASRAHIVSGEEIVAARGIIRPLIKG